MKAGEFDTEKKTQDDTERKKEGCWAKGDGQGCVRHREMRMQKGSLLTSSQEASAL